MITSIISLALLASFIQFPFTTVRACMKGYGDYNWVNEFHTGIDFPAAEGEYSLNPYGETCYSIGFFHNADMTEFVCVLSTDPLATTGFTYEHLYSDINGDEYRIGEEFDTTIGRLVDHPLGRHLHLTWFDLSTDELLPQPGYFNPFDSLSIPSGYDIALFDSIHTASLNYPLLAGRGIWFSRDDCAAFPGVDWFQDSLYGAVDIIVSPVSAYMGNSEQDSCGIRSIIHRIFRQSPYTSSYISSVFHDPRILFDMTGYLPDDADTTVWLPEFEAIFQNCFSHFINDYVITNSGVLYSVDSCLQNVWTDDYNRNSDWEDDEFCRGAWDTRLGNSNDHRLAYVNEHAAFPDGRYAVRVTAESQGSRDTAIRFLPAENIEAPESPINIRGVIVDNYIPYVDSVIVYAIDPFPKGVKIMFSAGWTTDSSSPLSDRTLNTSIFGYLPVHAYYRVGVAVKYSEPMNPDSLGDVWLTAGWGDSLTWTSTSNKNSWFLPTESVNPQLGIVYGGNEAHFWKCYETPGSCSSPGYLGRLTLHLGNTTAVPFAGPFDLAGNHLDSDPSTVTLPRDTVTGSWSSINYEEGVDETHSWGTAHNYSRRDEGVYKGQYCDRGLIVETVDGLVAGDHPYWCGFWLYREEPGEYGFNVNEVKPDGSYIDHSFETPFPVYDQGQGQEQWWYGRVSPTQYPTLSPDSRYFWMVGGTMDWINEWSTTFAYCVDSETGATIDGYEICSGWMFYGGRQNEEHLGSAAKWPLFFSQAEVMDIDTNGVVLISYIYFPEYCNQYNFVEGDTLLPPPSDRNDALSRDMFFASDSGTNVEEVIRILSNPVRESLDVRLIGEAGQDYELLLYDIAGRRVLSESGVVRDDESFLSIGVENLPSGVYLLRMRSGSFETVRTISIVR